MITPADIERAMREQGDDAPEITDEQAAKVAVLLSAGRR